EAADTNVTCFDAREVLRRGNIEIKCAWNWKIDRRIGREGGNDSTRIRPQQAMHRFAPTVRLSEQVLQLRLFICRVMTASRLELNLTPKDHGMNRGSRVIRHVQFENDMRSNAEFKRLGGFDRKVEIGAIHFAALAFR